MPAPEDARTARSSFSGEVLAAGDEYSAKNDARALEEGSVGVLGDLLELSEYYVIDCLSAEVSERCLLV